MMVHLFVLTKHNKDDDYYFACMSRHLSDLNLSDGNVSTAYLK